MKREIKFRYVIRHIETGNILTFEKPISEIERFSGLKWMINIVLGIEIQNGEHELVSRDEYTGLEDKNGKEIYEGDIMKWEDETEDLGIIKYDVNGCSFRIFFIKTPESSCHIGLNTHGKGTAIVIGNIHQNPELL